MSAETKQASRDVRIEIARIIRDECATGFALHYPPVMEAAQRIADLPEIRAFDDLMDALEEIATPAAWPINDREAMYAMQERARAAIAKATGQS